MKMQKALALCLALCLLISFPACQTEQDKKYDALVSANQAEASALPSELEVDYDAPNYIGPPKPDEDDLTTPVPGDNLSGTLAIRSYNMYGYTPAVTWLAKEFMELHPNVAISCEFGDRFGQEETKQERQDTRQDYYTRLRVEIAAGEADCLLYGVTQDLDYTSLSKNGALADFQEFWQNDPDIREEDYFMPVLDAFLVEGRRPVMPYSFNLTGVYCNRALLGEINVDPDSVTLTNAVQILDWYGQLRPQHPDLNLLFACSPKASLFPLERPAYIDLENRRAAVDSPEFVSFLAQSRDAAHEDPDLDPEKEINYGFGSTLEAALSYRATGEISPHAEVMAQAGYPADKNILLKARPALCGRIEPLAPYELAESRQRSFQYVAGPYFLTSSDGRLGITCVDETFVMPQSLKNKELAWEFIKYCLSRREDITFDHFGYTGQHYYTHSGIPVTRSNYRKIMEDAPEDLSRLGAAGLEHLHFDPVDGADMEAYMDELLTNDPVDLGKYNIDLQDYLDEFYINELTTPEQAAEKIQGRAYIWLNE